MLRALVPKLLREVSFEIHVHQGKPALLKRLPDRLNGYARRRANDPWFRDHCRVVVLVDRDDDDCRDLKKRIEASAKAAGHPTRTSTKGAASWFLVGRIVVEELEAWYFGDWEAVRAAYPRVASTIPAQAKYRDPDAIVGGTSEAFERVLQDAGYFTGGLRKIEAARAIAAQMHPARNRSSSFQRLRDVVLEFAS